VERLPKRAARELAGQVDRALALLRQEGRDEDESPTWSSPLAALLMIEPP
jgi:hypothetical protein